MRMIKRLLLAVAFAAGTADAQRATTTQRVDTTARTFERIEAMVPMRDGVKLHTVIYVPTARTAEQLPIIFVRTPYGISAAPQALTSSYAELAAEGYAFAFQDIRGRYTSEGQFLMLRPMRDRSDPKAVDESTDAYDTIDWLLKAVPRNNGRVGMMGVSYPGWLTVMAMLDPHPALKAVSPQASPADMFLGDDFYHNGAFRLSYGFEYATAMETNKELTPYEFGAGDLFDWYLRLGSLANVNTLLKGAIPTWTDFAAHSSYDAFWQRRGVTQFLDQVRVPTLSVAGWWDQEDFYGPVTIYTELEKHDTKGINYLVVGPWNHGGWNASSGQTLGNVNFGSHTSRHFRQNIQAPWFAYWLKDKGRLALPEATTFQSGTNAWMSNDSWPRRDVQPRRIYTRAGGQLSFAAPSDSPDSGFDSYLSDPANPVPYRARPIRPSFSGPSSWGRWLVDDQSFLDGRPDVLSWRTAPLENDVVVSGKITAHLFASTTGSDADWVVKLIDVYPDVNPSDPNMNGHDLMVANDVVRARFRNSFERPEAVVPGKVEEYVVDLHTQDYNFKRGHRIMVQVQSSWFPLIDRNPQTFVPNIFAARDEDFRAATHKIFRAQGTASYVELPIR